MTEAGTTHTVCIHCGYAYRTDQFNEHKHTCETATPSANPERQAA